MRIYHYEATRAQLGWNVTVITEVSTGEQFTKVYRVTRYGHRYLLVAMLVAAIRAKRDGRSEERSELPTRKAKGWA